MALYENLPIFRHAMLLAVQMEKTASRFPRNHRYALGSDLRKGAYDLVDGIIQANAANEEKTSRLIQLRDRAETLKSRLLIGKEIGIFRNFKEFQELADMTLEICRQSEGWLKSRRDRNRRAASERPSERVKDHPAPSAPAQAGVKQNPSHRAVRRKTGGDPPNKTDGQKTLFSTANADNSDNAWNVNFNNGNANNDNRNNENHVRCVR